MHIIPPGRRKAVQELTNWPQFFMCLSCYWSWISSSHCQSSCGSPDYFDNVMTKLIVNNRTDALNTDINLFFYGNRLSKFPLSFADASHKFQIHVSVRILTIKFSQWARVNFCSYRKTVSWQTSHLLKSQPRLKPEVTALVSHEATAPLMGRKGKKKKEKMHNLIVVSKK